VSHVKARWTSSSIVTSRATRPLIEGGLAHPNLHNLHKRSCVVFDLFPSDCASKHEA